MKHIYETKEDKKKAAIAKRTEKLKSSTSASADNKERQVMKAKKISSKQNVGKNGTSWNDGFKIPKKSDAGCQKSKLGEKRSGKEVDDTCERKKKKVMK